MELVRQSVGARRRTDRNAAGLFLFLHLVCLPLAAILLSRTALASGEGPLTPAVFPFMVESRLSAEIRESIRNAIIATTPHPSQDLFELKPFKVVADADYEPVRRLRRESVSLGPGLTTGLKITWALGVFPTLPVADIERKFAPVAAALGRALERPIPLRTSTSFAAFSARLDRELFAFVVTHPFEYARIADAFGYEPLVRVAGLLTGIIVVANDSPLQTVNDLRGCTLALPPPESAVSRLAILALLDAGLVAGSDLSLRYLPDHYACLGHLEAGRVDAGATTDEGIRLRYPREEDVRVRTLTRTRPVPSVLLAAHPAVPAAERDRVVQLILAWNGLPDSPIDRAFGTLVAANDGEYDVVREIERELAQAEITGRQDSK